MIPALRVLRQSNPNSKWPARGEGNPIEPVCRPAFEPRFTFDAGAAVFTIGSCFARNIEEYLVRLGLVVPARDFSVPTEETSGRGRDNGILNKYTPYSILNELRFAIDKIPPENALYEIKGKFIDLQLTSTVPVSFERAVARRGEIKNLFLRGLDCQAVVLTLGLVESWYDRQRKIHLTRMPPAPLLRAEPRRFFFHQMSVDDALLVTRRIITRLNASGAAKKILVTTSPVPMDRTFTADDVVVANTYSKSILRVAAQAARDRFDNVDYVPIYEMVTMSNRRMAWTDDQRHVRDDLVGEVVREVAARYFPSVDPVRQTYMRARMELAKGRRLAEAHETLKQSFKRMGNDPQVLEDFLASCSRTGHYRELLDALAAVDANGLSGRVLQHKAQACFQLGRTAEAIETQKLAISRSHKRADPRAQLALARMLERAGDIDAAQRAIRTARQQVTGKSPAELLTGIDRLAARLDRKVRGRGVLLWLTGMQSRFGRMPPQSGSR